MSDTKQTLIDLQREWMDAWRRDDRARLEEILAPEFTLTSARTDRLVDRTEWLRLLETTRSESFEYSDFLVQVFGDAAVVKSRLTQVATVGGQPLERDVHGDRRVDPPRRPLAGRGTPFEHATGEGLRGLSPSAVSSGKAGEREVTTADAIVLGRA
jgi:hypothetical protein